MRRLICYWVFFSIILGWALCSEISLHQYSSNGDLLQLEYARKAVLKGTPCFGIVGPKKNFSLLIAARIVHPLHRFKRSYRSPLSSFEGISLATSGIVGDCRYTKMKLLEYIVSNRFLLGSLPTIHSSAQHCTNIILQCLDQTKKSKDAVVRPLATSVLLSQWDRENDCVGLVRVDSGGNIEENCMTGIIGGVSDRVHSYLISKYSDLRLQSASLSDIVSQFLAALDECSKSEFSDKIVEEEINFEWDFIYQSATRLNTSMRCQSLREVNQKILAILLEEHKLE